MTLQDNLDAAVDALQVFRVNSKLANKFDPELEKSLIASVEHAKAEIQKFEEDKQAFWGRFYEAEKELTTKQKSDYRDFCSYWALTAKEMGYDN